MYLLKRYTFISLFIILSAINLFTQIPTKYMQDNRIFEIKQYQNDNLIWISKYKIVEDKIIINGVNVINKKEYITKEIIYEEKKLIEKCYDDENILYLEIIYYFDINNKLIKEEIKSHNELITNDIIYFEYSEKKLIKEISNNYTKEYKYEDNKLYQIKYIYKNGNENIAQLKYKNNIDYSCIPSFDLKWRMDKKEHNEESTNGIKIITDKY